MIRCHWCNRIMAREFIKDVIDDKEVCYNCSTRLHNFYCCYCDLSNEDDEE
jgi:hypothetical protein